VLGGELHSELIGFKYEPLSLIDPNNFRVHEAIPGLIYVFRYGRRRGKGRWTEVSLSDEPRQELTTRVTVRDVARTLVQESPRLEGFDQQAGEDIVSDWLAAAVVQTLRGTGEVDDPVQWIRPLHYFACWADLPKQFINLRSVPELLAGVMTDADSGVLGRDPSGPFSVAANPSMNILLEVLGHGVNYGNTEDLTGDRLAVESDTDIGPEELLCAVLGEQLGSAPRPIGGEGGTVPVYDTLCPLQARQLREDVSVLLRAYHRTMPSSVLIEYVCAILCANLNAFWLCHMATANRLYQTGYHDEVTAEELSLFFDAGADANSTVRQLAETAVAENYHMMETYVRTAVGLRLLARLVDTAELSVPDPSEDTVAHLQALANLRINREPNVEMAAKIYLQRLRGKFEEASELISGDMEAILHGQANMSAVDRLVEVLVRIQSELFERLRKFHTGCTGAATSYGIVRTHGVRPPVPYYSLTNPAIEALVHANCVKRNKTLAEVRVPISGLQQILCSKYGLLLDGSQASGGSGRVSQAVYDENLKRFNERLRMLGLLRDVSDAQAMQTLELTYPPEGGFRGYGRR